MNKYRNKRVNGYASKREAELAANLQALQRSGEISSLREQFKFVLVPSQKGELRNERPLTYTADFTYFGMDGKQHVIDAKGFKTQQYVIRRKLMKFIHDIEVEEL
jgi:hypothetical protein